MALHLEEELADFYFVFQPIFQVNKEGQPQVLKYELLLRSKSHPGFPFQVFQAMIATQEHNRQLMDWYFSKISQVLEEKTFAFGFNLDPQQLRYPETLAMLEQLAGKFSVANVTVEVTEHYYQNVADMELEIKKLVQTVKKIKGLGFQIAFDDVSSGLNDVELVSQCLGDIDTIKLSLLSFKELSFAEIFWITQTWQKIAVKHQLRLIVEGIDNRQTFDFLLENGIVYQQGFLFGQPLDYLDLEQV